MSEEDGRARDRSGAGLADIAGGAPAEIEALYDEWAGEYDADVESWGYEVPERIAAMVSDGGDPHGRVLDAGCGTGRVGVALRAAGVADIVGIDFSSASLDRAADFGVYASLVQVDLNASLPFDDDEFGVVVCAGVFSYLDDPAAVLREFVRVTIAGGRVVFSHRTDLWEQQDFDAVLATVTAGGTATTTATTHAPYLPGHPEFTDAIEVFYASLTVTR